MKFISRESINLLTKIRKGEKKVGQSIMCLESGDSLDDLPGYFDRGVRYALLGIPETIGIRGNFGSNGAERSWECFLQNFLNIQSNRFLSGASIICLGTVYTDELQAISDQLETGDPEYIEKTRALCTRLDELVYPTILKIVSAGLVPVIIGGGHNNSYPIIKGFSKSGKHESGISVLNCDPHADFRDLEGRHSGNGFSYAFHEGFLKKYFVMGLHESYNSENMLSRMENGANIGFSFFDFKRSFDALIEEAILFFNEEPHTVGLELDMDSIANMPASAFTPSGITMEEARKYIQRVARELKPVYLHLPEAAPGVHLNEQKYVGKALAYLVSDFIKARA